MGMLQSEGAAVNSLHEGQEMPLPGSWLVVGGKLFIENETHFRRGPRSSCHDLDELKDFKAVYQKSKSPKLFTDCMDDLEMAQREFRVAAPEIEHVCDKPHALIHTMWNGDLIPAARLGLLSFVLAYPRGCVRLMVWTTSDETRKSLQKVLIPRLGDAMEVQMVDFGDLCDRIVAVHPDLKALVDATRMKLQNTAPATRKQATGKQATGISDIVRMFAVAAYGGAYLDCDILLLRPLTPLLSKDFFYRWSFKKYCNTAAIHMKLGSYNAYKVIELSLKKLKRGMSLKNVFYPESFYRLIQKENVTIAMLPSAYFDPIWIVADRYGEGAPAALERYGLKHFNDFLVKKNENKNVIVDARSNFFPGAFAFHWHNQWKTTIQPGSSADIFLRQYYLEIQEP